MQRAIDAFNYSLDRVKHLGGLHEAIRSLTTDVLDTSDLLRAQVVLLISAFDYFIHEITAIGMIEIFNGSRQRTNAFQKYRVSLASYSSGSSDWFETDVREKHSFLSFQQPDKVADAIRLYSDIELWKQVAASLGRTAKDTKDTLTLIVERRNKIAHEADLDPSYPNTLWPITRKDVDDSIDFIRAVGNAIFALTK
jgi:hypothetical protein